MRLLAALWLVILVSLGIGAGYVLSNHHTKLVADIQLLFPTLTSENTETIALNKSVARLSDNLVFVLGHSSKAVLRNVQEEFAVQLKTEDLAEMVQVSSKELAHLRALQISMAGLIASSNDRKLLETDDGTSLVQRALVNLYMPSSNLMGQILQQDPLGLLPSYMAETAGAFGGTVFRAADGTYYVPFNATLIPSEVSGLGREQQIEKILQVVEDTLKQNPDFQIFYTGSPFYADQIAKTSKSEAISITIIATIGILILLLIAFRSLQSILGAVITISSGVFTGAAVTFIVFDTVHLIAVAFGASLVGVVVDYAIHYYATRRAGESAVQTSSRIRFGTGLALLTTVLGFAALLFVDISILRQIAVYSIFGVVGAVVSVLILLPQSAIIATGRGLSEPSDRFHRTHYRLFKPYLIPVFWIICLGGGGALVLSILPADDGVGRLRVVTPALSAAEVKIAMIGGQGQARAVLIEGSTYDELLQREEAVIDLIKASAPQIKTIGISTLYPSMQRQVQTCEMASDILGGPEAGPLRSIIPGILPDCTPKELKQQAFFQLPSMVRQLAVLDGSGAVRGQLLMLSSVPATMQMSELLPSDMFAHDLNITAVYSNGFQAMRSQATWALIGGILIVMVGFSIGFGLRKGMAAALVPTFAALASLALTAVFGSGLSLFSVMAAFLVYALGADYALFQLAAVKEDTARAYRAVGLSSLSTLLVFGLMAMSAIPVLQIMGTVVVTGVFIAWLIAPIARVYNKEEVA